LDPNHHQDDDDFSGSSGSDDDDAERKRLQRLKEEERARNGLPPVTLKGYAELHAKTIKDGPEPVGGGGFMPGGSAEGDWLDPYQM
jgi:hypothetical protein